MTAAKEFARADHNIHVTLVETLELAVPLWIWELAGRTDEQRVAIARRCAAVVAERGDILMFGSKTSGFKTAQAFNALAEGIAASAFLSGGINFAGRHWCTNHRLCLEAAATASEAPAADCDPTPTPSAPKRLVETTAFGKAVRGLL